MGSAARARWARAALLLYLASVALIAFGHRCAGVTPGLRSDAPGSGARIARAAPADSGGHVCPACQLQRQDQEAADSWSAPTARRIISAILPLTHSSPIAGIARRDRARGPPAA